MLKVTAAPMLDCTIKCHSTNHGNILTSAITKRCVSDGELSSFMIGTCHCCESVADSEGRTALHVAASCGRTDLVRWLIENRHANINVKDKESGYTALHRSVFYGRIDTAVELVKLGASLTVQDANGLTYLEHAMFDRFYPSEANFSGGELFTWGSNSNNSLGSQHPRLEPETMDIFHKEYPTESVMQILIGQFHSVILTESGSIYSCGHGQSGRLGLGIQQTEVIPRQVKFLNSNNVHSNSTKQIQIVSCSIARDHSLFLASSGELYACGLNKHKVLGIAPPPAELLVPTLLKHLADEASAVASGNYHSLVWNKSGIFTWGLNAGQLGHKLLNPSDKYILTAKRVKCINFQEKDVKLVCASTGATVVYTEKGDLYTLEAYQCRKVASKELNLVEIAVIGGNLNHTLDPELSNKNRELKVAALTNTGNLLLWQANDPVLRRCIFSINRALSVKQVALNISNILFVTKDGEAFKGEIKPRKNVRTTKDSKDSKSVKSHFHKFVDRNECVNIKLERIPRVHRSISIQTDPKGQNFAVIQDRPYKYFDNYDIAESTMCENMHNLISTAEIEDGISDIEFRISGTSFPAHRYILASRSQYFAYLFLNNHEPIIDIKHYNPVIFEEFLRYIYTGTTELIQIGELRNEALISLCAKTNNNEKENLLIDENKQQKKFENPVRMLHEMAKRFEVIDLQKILSNLDMVGHLIKLKKGGSFAKKNFGILNKNLHQELYDVDIRCKDGRMLHAHKCVLAARLDYFASMFSSRWKGGEISQITMPFAKGVVEALLEFLYTDSLDRLEEKDMDQLFKIIILADQFFVTRLKNQCENLLSNLLTIKNAVQLLTFADNYNADMLKENCFEFIQQNVTSFLEMRLLDEVESRLLKELSEFYQIKRRLDCRVITPYSTAVSDEEIAQISSMYPVDITEKKEKAKQKVTGSARKRNRSQKQSVSDKTVFSSSIENEHFLPFESNVSNIEILSDSSTIVGRVKSILIANEIGKTEEIYDNFTRLNKKSDCDSLSSSFVDSFEFPLLNSPPKPSIFHGRIHKTEARPKVVKLSQKERKRLSSESNIVATSPNLAESPKNPWKIIQDPVSPIGSLLDGNNMETIMSSEKKQKENLVKITSKPLIFTQLEDRAIEELKKFYNVDNMEDEVIIVERVSMGAVALPVWVPKTK